MVKISAVVAIAAAMEEAERQGSAMDVDGDLDLSLGSPHYYRATLRTPLYGNGSDTVNR